MKMNDDDMTNFERVVDELLNTRTSDGVWAGRLSSSALATAIAIRAFKSVDPAAYSRQIEAGSAWLESTQREDGGWGDTVRSSSNVSTTVLALAAIHDRAESRNCRDLAMAFLDKQFGSATPDAIVAGILARYGEDRTFSAPILALAAVSGILGDERTAWKHVPQLPFELAILPQTLFKWFRLDVVSYAIPALIAIGFLRHSRRPSRLVPLRILRNGCMAALMRRLERMQPDNGGFLEATPLTAFVTMALAESGFRDHVIVKKGVQFLLAAMREDGSWPIDSDLSTWITSQAIKGISGDALSHEDRKRLRIWYERQQFHGTHPFTSAAPGGWGWTPRSGAVPDADDTAGALIALKRLSADDLPTKSVTMGIEWLINLQNGDGGIPTFCRGWGRLPFDRSCPDVTAHAVEAVSVWYPLLSESRKRDVRRFARKSIDFLKTSQNDDGCWHPLWFGNEHVANQVNPCYGTAMVLGALHGTGSDWRRTTEVEEMMRRAANWLWCNRNDDGGWGGSKGAPSSREETALAISALAPFGEDDRLISAIAWLNENWHLPPTPIGLYFSSLWYFEDAYPLVFAARAHAAVNDKRPPCGS